MGLADSFPFAQLMQPPQRPVGAMQRSPIAANGLVAGTTASAPVVDPTGQIGANGLVQGTSASATPQQEQAYQEAAQQQIAMQRRNAQLGYNPDNPDDPMNPNNTNSAFTRGLTSSLHSLPAMYQAGRKLVDQMTGDTAGAQDALQRMRRINEESAAIGPKISDFSQVHGAGDLGGYLAGKAGEFLPTAAQVAAGAVIGAATGGAAIPAEVGIGAAEAAGTAGLRAVAERALVKGAESGVLDAAAGGAAPAAADAAVGIGANQTAEAAARVAAQQAAEQAGSSAEQLAAHQTARKIGSAMGEFGALLPQNLPTAAENSQGPGDTIGTTSDALKSAAGAVGATAFQTLGARYLLGTLGGNVEKSLLPKATDTIAQQIKQYVPRVAAAAARNGVVMGTTNVLATATQLATHKWVDGNVDLLSHDAFNQYLQSLTSGAALGIVAGGGGAALHGIPRPHFGAAHLRWLESLGAKAKAAFPWGEKLADVPTGEPPGAAAAAASEAMNKATHAPYETGAPSAADAFQQHVNDLNAAEEGAPSPSGAAPTVADEPLEAIPDPTEKQMPRDNPVQMSDPIQNRIASYIPYDSTLWKTPSMVRNLARSAGKLFTGEPLDANDEAHMALWSHIVGPERVAQWREGGAEYAKLTASTDAADAAPEGGISAELQQSLDAMGRGDDEGMAQAETSDPSEVVDAVLPPPKGVNAIPGSQMVAPINQTVSDRLLAAEPGSPEHAALQDQLRTQLLRGGGSHGAPLTENLRHPEFFAGKDPAKNANTVGLLEKKLVNTRQVGAWQAKVAPFDAAMADAQARGEAAKTAGDEAALAQARADYKQAQAAKAKIGPEPEHQEARQALQLDTLITNKLKEMPNGSTPKQALIEVLKDMHLAGLHPDPATITPGKFYTSAGGEEANLSPQDARVIRASLEGKDKQGPMSEAAKNAGARKQASAAADVSERAATAADQAGMTVDQLAHQKAILDENGQRGEAGDGSGDSRIDQSDAIAHRELGIREPPPQMALPTTGGTSTSGTGVVADVQLHPSPYEDIVNKARRDSEAAEIPADRAQQIKHEAGIKIGEAELAKELHPDNGSEPTISEARYDAEMKRLHDYDSGLSRKYLRQAEEGKFDSGAVRETARDTSGVGAAPRAKADARETVRTRVQSLMVKSAMDAIRDAKKAIGAAKDPAAKADAKVALEMAKDQLKTAKFPKPQDIADKITELDAKAPRDRTPEEAKVLGIARNASDVLGPEHPFSQAFEQHGKNIPSPDDIRETLKNREAADKKAESDAPVAADEPIDAGVKAAASPEGPHDLAKETEMVNGLLHAAGIDSDLKVAPHPISGGAHLDPNTNTLHINENLHGPERMEVLMHEVGHHIVFHEIGKLLGKTPQEVAKMNINDLFGVKDEKNIRRGGALAKVAPELHKALMDDLGKWEREHSDPDANATDVLLSRKPMNRGAALADTDTGKLVKDLTAERAGYLYSPHEWLADHISRALTTSEKPTTIIGKFFGKIADGLKAAYAKLVGTPEGAKNAPAPSVKAWVDNMFERTKSDVGAALDRTVSTPEAKTAIENALHIAHGGDTPSPAASDAFGDFFNHQLKPSDRRVIYNAVTRRVIQAQIVARYGHDEVLMKRLEDAATSEQTAAHLAYTMWTRGELKLGTHPVEIMRALRNSILKVLGVATGSEQALKLFEDIHNGEVARLNPRGAKTEDMKYDLPARLAAERGRTQVIFNAAQKISRQYVYDPWRRIMFGKGENIEKSMSPALSQVAALVKRHTGEVGDRGTLPTVVKMRQHFYNELGDVHAPLTDAQKTALHEAMQKQQRGDQISDPVVRKAADAQDAVLTRIREYAVRKGVPLGEVDKFYPVVMDKKAVAGDETGFKKLLSNPKFEPAIRRFFSHDGAVSKQPIEKLIDNLYHYATTDVLPKSVEERAGSPPDMSADARIADAARRASSEKTRSMEFIYRHGTPEEIAQFQKYQSKDPERVLTRYVDSMVRRAESVERFGVHGEKLAALLQEAHAQHATPADIQYALDYVAAANGRIASDGSPFVRKVFTKLGRPELGEKINDKLFGPKGEAVQDLAMAYQNVRVLPLSLLSSLVDPLGGAIRMGGWKDVGDVKATWKALKEGLAAASGKGPVGLHLRDLARAISMADDYLNTEILSTGNADAGMSGLARKMSDAMFKYNGMAWWVKGTRYMALSMGQHFLLKHAADAEPGGAGSARYLRELGVKASDIKRDPVYGGIKLLSDMDKLKATPEEIASDQRVRDALNQFVDESILRTDTSQHPAYMDDPAFRLVSQYKRFTYAFGDQILGRLHHEMYYNNFHVLGPALAYLPVTLMAETLRGMIQYGPGGNPQHKNWDLPEEFAFLGQRSGMVGPRAQMLVRGWEGESSAYSPLIPSGDWGPTASELGDIGKTIAGKRSAERTAIEALPASTAYQHWISTGSGSAQPATQ